MRVSREQAALNRERVIEHASHLFRQHGFDGIGVADLMKSAGLTHGGFYGHFPSKEALAALTCEHAFAQAQARWSRLLADAGGDPLPALIEHYVSPRHRDDPGHGCALSSLGAEAHRRSPAVRRAFQHGLSGLLDLLTRAVRGRSAAARRRKALATLAGMVGAVVLARAVEDRALSDEILAATAEALVS
ncbi:TetR/AcrR family transcriptional regulator [Dokdonella koreensis]|uniref:TetR family transcriptional regulator n=1 Tax=Dokdonella koreensis DS-123 TaxID=1300342 RepID=A0A160DRI7_9GAMM|nr:TetR/AcrR family transcriptional regulator [Dokdonella koreensis]ANB16749.1 Putative TetR family transcriptional regulator [Dokdonella koreensis DS-123]